ncbi:MAG TPA: hypothetical protein VLF61_01875 [Rhabdochlamydiaceae bacterium]|nr:hypothetical protein [Rhabdochlamydiaceae bacterium]
MQASHVTTTVAVPTGASANQLAAPPARSSGSSRLFEHWRSGVLTCATALAVWGFAKTFIPLLAFANFDPVVFAILAGVSLYYAKDSYDREEGMRDLSDQLQLTEARAAAAETRLEEATRRLETDEQKLSAVAEALGLEAKEMNNQNQRFERSNDMLASTVTKIEQILART